MDGRRLEDGDNDALSDEEDESGGDTEPLDSDDVEARGLAPQAQPPPAVVDLAAPLSAASSSSESDVEFVPTATALAMQRDAIGSTLLQASTESDSDVDDDLPLGLDSSRGERPAKRRRRLKQHADSSKKTQAKATTPEPPKPTVIVKAEPTECSVCYDPCTKVGRHRLVSLKCGHVYGKKCIERWVAERKSCPNCNVSVRKADIRPLFTDHVAVVDNTATVDMTDKFEAEKSRRILIETELSRAKLQVQLAQAEATRWQQEAAQWRQRAADLQCQLASDRFTAANKPESTSLSTPTRVQPLRSTPSESTPRREPSRSQPFASQAASPTPAAAASAPSPSPTAAPMDGWSYRPLFRYSLQSARVFAISKSCSLLCVGEAFSPTSHGILKLSAADTRHTIRISAHQSPVRDLCLSASEDLVLSIAFDGRLAVASLRSDSVVQQYALPPGRTLGWSCCLSDADPHALYCGLQDGTVAKYDMRRPALNAAPVALFSLPVRQPVHSVKLSPGLGANEQLVAATFSGVGVWDQLSQAPSETVTPASSFVAVSNCSSLASDPMKRSRLVVTSRAPPPTHSVYELHSPQAGGQASAKKSQLRNGDALAPVAPPPALWTP
ncbi:hypothetical protein P43SY_008206 [Pythium insidiosum]|uniref:RING-type E3 ubiquitin transferase n=1 Tax=Pythium insidiosum TaxID=114742 RepID=A0AAD5M7I2_PYTIN|nr:hypothetical protein P43SY_008206 [Pythium insidiosum]